MLSSLKYNRRKVIIQKAVIARNQIVSRNIVNAIRVVCPAQIFVFARAARTVRKT